MNSANTRTLLHATFVLLLLAASAFAHAGGRVYPIPYLTDEMLADIQLEDGSIDEWYDLLGEPTMTLLDFADETWGSKLDPSDLDFRIWLAWHDEPARLYVAFAASDDLYKNTHDYGSDEFEDSMYFQDGIFLAIDADHSGGQGTAGLEPSEWLEVFGQTQFYTAIPYTGSGPTLADEGMTAQTGTHAWTVLPPFAEAGGGTGGGTPAFSVIELYVTPFDRFGAWDSSEGSLVSDLETGKVIGLAIAANDLDPPDFPTTWTPEAMEPSGDLPPAILLTDRRAGRLHRRHPSLLRPGGAGKRLCRGIGFLGPDQGLPGDGLTGVPAILAAFPSLLNGFYPPKGQTSAAL